MRLENELETLRSELTAVRKKCEDQQDTIADLASRLTTVRAAAEERAALIATLDAALEREREDFRSAESALRLELAGALATAADRSSELSDDAREPLLERIAMLERVAQERADLVEQLQKTCEDRLGVIQRITADAEGRSVLLNEMTAAFESSLRRIEALRAESRRLS